MPVAPVCGALSIPSTQFLQLPGLTRLLTLNRSALQDDTYTESYISTIGVDFVSGPCLFALVFVFVLKVALLIEIYTHNAENKDRGAGWQSH